MSSISYRPTLSARLPICIRAALGLAILGCGLTLNLFALSQLRATQATHVLLLQIQAVQMSQAASAFRLASQEPGWSVAPLGEEQAHE